MGNISSFECNFPRELVFSLWAILPRLGNDGPFISNKMIFLIYCEL